MTSRGLLKGVAPALGLAALAVSCASTLTVRVSLYDGDPTLLRFIDNGTAQAMSDSVDAMCGSAIRVPQQRKYIADKMFQIYEQLWIMTGQDKASIREMRRAKATYLARVEASGEKLRNSINLASQRLAEYRDAYERDYPQLFPNGREERDDSDESAEAEASAFAEWTEPCPYLGELPSEAIWSAEDFENVLSEAIESGRKQQAASWEEVARTARESADRAQVSADSAKANAHRADSAARDAERHEHSAAEHSEEAKKAAWMRTRHDRKREARPELEIYRPSRESADPERVVRLRMAEDIAKATTQAVSSAFAQLSVDAQADYGLQRRWGSVEAALKPQNTANLRRLLQQEIVQQRVRGRSGKEAADLPSLKDFDLAQARSQRLLKELARDLRLVAEDPETVNANVRQRLNAVLAGQAVLADSARQLINASNSLLAAPPLGERTRDALIYLVQNSEFALAQIDRLQDAGDPVWRIVSRPENASRWNETFSRTYFYAEGDSRVVVVRDNPMTYRVQRGTNDPTALVRNQLMIARTVTDAAVSIAAAASGLPIGGLASFTPSAPAESNGSGTVTPGDTAVVAEAKSFAEKRANAKAEARVRRAAIRSLDINLRNVQQLLLTATTNEQKKHAVEQLRAVLSGSKPHFETP